MRAFGIVSPQFWTGRTGKEIQAVGAEAIVLATYLMTGPHAHMCGLYYLPKKYIEIDTGRPGRAIEGAMKQLGLLPSGGFAFYDESNQYVWVPEMLCWQAGQGGPLNPQDSKLRGIVKWHAALPKIPFAHAFYDRYKVEIPGLCSPMTPPTTGPNGGVIGPERPLYLSPVPVLSPVAVLEGGTGETKKPELQSEPCLVLGEFGKVRLTADEYAKLKERLNGHTDDFISQLDRWAVTEPAKFAKRKNHYATLLTWFDRAVKDGKVYGKHQSHSGNGSTATPGSTSYERTTRSGAPQYTPKQ